MQVDSMVIYFVVVMATVGILVASVFWISNLVTDQESKLTGIWTNDSNTIKILIYLIDTRYQAEVIWAKDQEERLLGADIIRNMSFKYFKWGVGTYIDPFTRNQFTLNLKLKSAGSMEFNLIEKSGLGVEKSESWTHIQDPANLARMAA
jgi:hypothetical protein